MVFSIIVLNVKYVIIESTLVIQLEYLLNDQRTTVCPSAHLPDFAKSVLTLFEIVPVSEIICQNCVCDNSKSCDTCSQWFIGPVLDHVCNISYCSYCSKAGKPDHQCFIDVKKRFNVKSWRFLRLLVYSKHN